METLIFITFEKQYDEVVKSRDSGGIHTDLIFNPGFVIC